MTHSATWHAGEMLGAYCLGVLEPGDARTIEDHLTGCVQCRAELAELAAVAGALGDVPPEAFLDGPPDGELVLRRTLRAARAESARGQRRQSGLVAAGIAALVAAALGAGVVLGQHTGARVTALPGATAGPSSGSVSPGPQPSGTVISGTDPLTGAAMTVSITPAMGWVRVHATIRGVQPGLKCQLLVVPRSGAASVVAGSWLSTEKGQHDGVPIDGAALVAPDDVAAVEVATLDGQTLVSVST